MNSRWHRIGEKVEERECGARYEGEGQIKRYEGEGQIKREELCGSWKMWDVEGGGGM